MHNKDIIRLKHMLEASKKAIAFADSRNRNDLEKDQMLLLALVKLIEIIGEAANKVSPEVRETYTYIPWADIIAMRNRLIHGYFDINLDVIWNTLKEELPRLVKDLKKALK